MAYFSFRFTLISIFMGFLLGMPGLVKAQTFDFTVNTLLDENDAVVGDGVCSTGPENRCSIRAALEEGNSHVGFETNVTIPSGVYLLILGGLEISQSANLLGQGDEGAMILLGVGRILAITNTSINVLLSNVTLEGSTLAGDGVGIWNDGADLTLEKVTIRNNTSFGGNGAGIYNSSGGNLSIFQSTINGNESNSGGSGAGIYSDSGTVNIRNSTLSGNVADGMGGAIYNTGGSEILLNNSTVNKNSARTGANLFNSGSTVSLRNSIVANSPTGNNCSGPLSSQGNNIDSDESCGFNNNGDQSNTDPILGPLQANGGMTETHALLDGSPAIDSGDNSTCLATDQRGVTRPQGTTCDIGAFELEQSSGGNDNGGGSGNNNTSTGGCSLNKNLEQTPSYIWRDFLSTLKL